MQELIVAVVFLAASAPAAGEIEVAPGEVRPGEQIQVSGSGCAGATPVTLRILSPNIRSRGVVASGPTGDFAATIEIPQTARPGRAWIRTSCRGLQESVNVVQSIRIRPPPLAITGVNVLFGLGMVLLVTGAGIAWRGRPHGRRSRRRKRSVRRNGKGGRFKHSREFAQIGVDQPVEREYGE